MICYHGTTAKGLRAILSGENHKPNMPWNVSDQDDCMYLWPADKIAGEWELTNEEPEYAADQGRRLAFESAQVQALVSEDFTLYALELLVDPDDLEDDYSCENMSSEASYITLGQFHPVMIQRVFKLEMNKWHAPFVAAGLLGNDYFNQCCLSTTLEAAAKAIKAQEVYLEEVHEFDDFEEVKDWENE